MLDKKLWVGFVLVISVGLKAQGLNPRVSVFGSASLLKGERNFTLFQEAFRSEYVTGGKIGVRGTMDLGDKWSLEAAYRFGNNNLYIVEELGTTHAERRTFGIRQHQVTGSVLRFVNNRKERIPLYVIAGGGFIRFSPTEEARAQAAREFVNNPAGDIRAENKRSFHFGTGVEAKLASSWGIRVEILDHIVGIPRFGLPKSNPGGGADFYPVTGIMHDIDSSFGLVYRWSDER
jgi:hypothetical protein